MTIALESPNTHLAPALVVSQEGIISSLLPFPALNCGFTEISDVRIGKPSGLGWSFRIDDEPLKDAVDKGTETWQWTPGFYAGEVTGELVGDSGSVIGTYLIDVSPTPQKLGREMFLEMINDLFQEDPLLLLGCEPAQTSIGISGRTHNPLLTFARLKRHGPTFIHALVDISSAPIQTIRNIRERVPFHRAKQADRQTVREALRDPIALRILSGVTAETSDADHLLHLDIRKSVSHLDGAANRCISALAFNVLNQIHLVSQSLEILSKRKPSDTRTSFASRWPVRAAFLRNLERQLKKALSRPPFSVVTRREITAAGLNAAASHPLYSRAHTFAWRILRSGVSGPQNDERLWMSPTWEIYERWCFVKFGAFLRATRKDLEWSRSTSHESNAEAAWIGRSPGSCLELLLQPQFNAWDQTGAKELRSISGQLIPDIVLITRDSPSRFIVLDAKYRVARESVLEGMRSAHIYHDALRFDDQAPTKAILLTPSHCGASWLEAPEFHEKSGVGAIALNPEHNLEHHPIARVLQSL